MHKPVKYLVLIEAGGAPLARLFDEDRHLILDIDAGSEEVADMTAESTAERGATASVWDAPLRNHNAEERRAAEVFTLDL